jgi:hypothetical protein
MMLPRLKEGDIFGMSGYHWSSLVINVLTYGVPFYSCSHVGVVGSYNGRLVLFESVTSDPTIRCSVQLKLGCDGVICREFDDLYEQYSGKIYHYPLYRSLYLHERRRLNDYLVSKVGTPYDLKGAPRSGAKIFAWMNARLNAEDLNSIFCSELGASTHAHIGLFPTDSGSAWSPNAFLRQERRMGVLRRPNRRK